MKKQIKKIATSIAITFSKEEAKLYGIKVGDIVDIELSKTQGANSASETPGESSQSSGEFI